LFGAKNREAITYWGGGGGGRIIVQQEKVSTAERS